MSTRALGGVTGLLGPYEVANVLRLRAGMAPARPTQLPPAVTEDICAARGLVISIHGPRLARTQGLAPKLERQWLVSCFLSLNLARFHPTSSAWLWSLGQAKASAIRGKVGQILGTPLNY